MIRFAFRWIRASLASLVLNGLLLLGLAALYAAEAPESTHNGDTQVTFFDRPEVVQRQEDTPPPPEPEQPTPDLDRPLVPLPDIPSSIVVDLPLQSGSLSHEVGAPPLGDLFRPEVNGIRGAMIEAAVDEPPVVHSQVLPVFPPQARELGISGWVTLRVLVDERGQVEEARVESSQPSGIFDEAALMAIRQWRFTPAVFRGERVAVWCRQRIRFDLE